MDSQGDSIQELEDAAGALEVRWYGSRFHSYGDNKIDLVFILIQTDIFGGDPKGTKQSENVSLCEVVLRIPTGDL